MNDLADQGSPGELRDLRAEVAGHHPEELSRARDLLLAEINTAREETVPRRRGGRVPIAHSRFRSPFARPLWSSLTVAAAAAAVAVLVVSLLPSTTARQPHPGQRPAVTPALTAAYILTRAASAAGAAATPVPRPGQYIYVTSVTTYPSFEVTKSGFKVWLYKTSRQIWQSVDGQRTGLLQITLTGYQKLPWGPRPPAITGDNSGWSSLPTSSCPGAAPQRGTYAFLATLPTDPSLLRAWIYQHPGGTGYKPDEQAWSDIGDMLREMLVPPKLAAALFRVAATIPGATVVPHATNAIGQSGVAVSRSGTELIFNPRTYQLIGEGAVLTKAAAGEGPAGTVTASTAQLRARVISRLPDIPPSQISPSGSNAKCPS